MSADRHDLSDRDPLGLAALPELAPPRDAWPALARRLAHRRERRPRWLLIATAASLVLSLVLITLLSTRLEGQQREIERWIAYSQRLERELDTVARRSAALRGHEALALAELEDRVAVVDAQLAHPDHDQQLALWQQRTALMQDLLTVHAMAGGRHWEDPPDKPLPVVTRAHERVPAIRPADFQK